MGTTSRGIVDGQQEALMQETDVRMEVIVSIFLKALLHIEGDTLPENEKADVCSVENRPFTRE